jgi:hypothetical protein
MNNFQVRMPAKFQSICLRCSQRVKVGTTIVQEESGKWSHAVCPGARVKVRTPEEMNVREFTIKIGPEKTDEA